MLLELFVCEELELDDVLDDELEEFTDDVLLDDEFTLDKLLALLNELLEELLELEEFVLLDDVSGSPKWCVYFFFVWTYATESSSHTRDWFLPLWPFQNWR